MDIRYYCEDISKVPFKLLVHAMSPTMPKPLAMVVATVIVLMGKFGKKLPPGNGMGFPGTSKVVGPESLPAPAMARWAPLLEQLKDLGFEPLKCELAETVGPKLNCSTTLLDQEGTTIAILEWSRMSGANGIEETSPLEFDSYRDDAPDLVTGVVRKIDVPMAEALQLGSVEMVNLENNRPLAECYRQHRQRCQGKQVLRLNEESAHRIVLEHNQQRFDEVMQQGIIRELKAEEIERLRQADLTELHRF